MIMYIMRHGSADYEHDSLNELGRAQAEALGKRLYRSGIDCAYVSPMGRVRETAAPACRRLGITPQVEPWLSEQLNHEALTFKGGSWYFDAAVEDARGNDRTPFDMQWYKNPVYRDITDGERRWLEVMSNADRLCAEHGYVREGLLYRSTGVHTEKVAVFCHYCMGLTLTAYLLGMSPAFYGSCFGLYTTGVTILDFGEHEAGERTSPICLCHSDLSHLYEAELPLYY